MSKTPPVKKVKAIKAWAIYDVSMQDRRMKPYIAYTGQNDFSLSVYQSKSDAMKTGFSEGHKIIPVLITPLSSK